MSQVQTIPALSVQSRPLTSATDEAVSIPWTIWFIAAGMALNVIGEIWDGTWHASIGVDTSWAPPHILTQISAVVALIACAYVILATTLAGASPERDASVRVLGLHAPAGAFIATWGCIAMLVAGFFDNWWHQAYGDVTIVTPPHFLLLLGSSFAKIGGMVWIASIMNRSTDALRGRLTWLFLFMCSTSLVNLAGFIPGVRSMHTADFYLTFALAIPVWLAACGWGSAHKWGATIVAAFYTVILLAAEWLLPLFPAQPKVGPVFHNITHLIPPGFPLLLIVPAFFADVLLQTLRQRSSWIKPLWLGPGLVLSFLAVQWPFANFLLLPASRNWIFGTAYFSYGDPAGLLYDPYKFVAAQKPATFLLTMGAALVASIVATGLGLAWGNWMRLVRR
ncbi:MAG: hypothetical protein LAP21_21615 [Acidobacteriia bacterium]|nr:hypothetical protein [Terriglobia bacterium]